MASTSTADPDGTEDVNDFLLRIRELGEKRDKEDDQRTRKIEDEILQGRKERQARRAGNNLYFILILISHIPLPFLPSVSPSLSSIPPPPDMTLAGVTIRTPPLSYEEDGTLILID